MDLYSAECFPVSSDDILTPEEIYENWDLVDIADATEIDSLWDTGGTFRAVPWVQACDWAGMLGLFKDVTSFLQSLTF